MTEVAGELERYGFEELEPGLVQDTPENRRRVYALESGWQYERVLEEDGSPSGLIRPLSPEMISLRRDAMAERKRSLLQNREDNWSDYVLPEDFPLDADAPNWVYQRLRRWRQLDSEGVPENQRSPFPIRCTHIRNDNTRCWNWVSKPQETNVCTPHLKAKGDQHNRHAQLAKIRLLEMTSTAVDQLEYLALHADGEAVKLKANTEILDRAGVRAGVDVDITAQVEVSNPADAVHKRLAMLAERMTLAQEKAAAAAALPAAPEEAETVQGETVE